VTRAVLLAAVVAVLASPGPAAAQDHTRTGHYQNMGREVPADFRTPYALVDGVPMVDYGTFRARNPVTTAQWGLANWTLWVRDRNRRGLRLARRAADWLVATQRRNGQWAYDFAYRSPGTTMELAPGWGSALAQGQAISLLRRLYSHRRQPGYLRAARRAVAPMGRSVTRGGLARWRHGGIVFEEYPTERRSLPLNGHLQALFGLYDLADVSRRARRLFRRGAASTVRILPDYDGGRGRSLYSLVHLSGFRPLGASDAYHAAHVAELLVLDALSPHPVFRHWARRWSP
jgi:hypothetical protein